MQSKVFMAYHNDLQKPADFDDAIKGVETRLAEWLADKRGIKLDSVTQSSVVLTGNRVVTTLVVFYHIP